MSALDLVARHPTPSEETVHQGLEGKHLPLHGLHQHRQVGDGWREGDEELVEWWTKVSAPR